MGIATIGDVAIITIARVVTINNRDSVIIAIIGDLAISSHQRANVATSDDCDIVRIDTSLTNLVIASLCVRQTDREHSHSRASRLSPSIPTWRYDWSTCPFYSLLLRGVTI